MEISGVVVGTYLVILVLLAVYGFHRSSLVFLYYRHRDKAPRALGTFSDLPAVTVQLPLFNEMYVAQRLLDAVAQIDWPRDRLEIQVLDDSTDETQEICKRKVEEL
ncbi:MAG TPA: glycosyl transferase family 2, partial [Polyangia bacterium]|nr:glycosyl transferase family 2 [Polyangia bacterium]